MFYMTITWCKCSETLRSVLEEITAAGHGHYDFCSPRHQSAKRGHLGLTGSSVKLHPRSSQLMLSGQHHLLRKLKDTHAALFYVEIKFLVIKKQQFCHTCTAHKRWQETNQLFQDAERKDVASYVWTCCSRVYCTSSNMQWNTHNFVHRNNHTQIQQIHPAVYFQSYFMRSGNSFGFEKSKKQICWSSVPRKRSDVW